MDACSVITSQPTIAAGLALGGHALVLVTSAGASLWSDPTASVYTASWQVEAGKEVVCAQVVAETVVVALRGGEVVVLSIDDHGFTPTL
jgi:hypothetical protein